MTNLKAVEIAKLTAQITGGGYKRANSKEAAIKRFVNVATEAGMVEPEIILASADFAEASEAIATYKAETDADLAAQAAPKAPAKKKAEPSNGQSGTAKPLGKRAQIEASAREGVLPEPPDFSADTHKPYRARLAEVVAMVEKADVKGLKAFEIKTYSSSPKAIDRYRNLAVIALEARVAKAA